METKTTTINPVTAGHLHWIASRPWLMHGPAMKALIAAVVSGRRLSEAQAAGAAEARAVRIAGSVAIIPILGPILHRGGFLADWYGAATVQGIRKAFQAALGDDDVKAIVFEVDSPGGEADGTPELAAEIFAARGRKPMVAVVNTMQCSAAHWIGAQADTIIATPSGEVGSIGVWTMHVNESDYWKAIGLDITLVFAGEHKVDGHSYAPLSAEVKADWQDRVDQIHADFLEAIAQARGTTAQAVREAYGEGQVYAARQAKRLKIVDGVGTIQQVVDRLAGSPRGRRAAMVSDELAVVEPVSEPPRAGLSPSGASAVLASLED